MSRILFHAINGVGLGHQRRTALIAAAARSLGADTLVVSEANATDQLDVLGIDSVTIRMLASVFDQELGAATQNQFLQTISDFNPDLIVYDTHFVREVIYQLAADGRRQALILRYTNASSIKNLLGGTTASHMTAILMPYERTFIESLPPQLFQLLVQHPRVAFTGVVVEQVGTDHELAAHYGLDQPTVLVSAGAGGKPGAEQFYHDALSVAKRHANLARFLFVLGPYAKVTLAETDNIRILDEEPRLRNILTRFSAGLLMPGYNALHEVMAARLPSVIRHAHQLYEEDPEPMLNWLEKRGCIAVAQGVRSMQRRLYKLLIESDLRHSMAAAWPDVQPGALRAAQALLHAVEARP